MYLPHFQLILFTTHNSAIQSYPCSTDKETEFQKQYVLTVVIALKLGLPISKISFNFPLYLVEFYHIILTFQIVHSHIDQGYLIFLQRMRKRQLQKDESGVKELPLYYSKRFPDLSYPDPARILHCTQVPGIYSIQPQILYSFLSQNSFLSSLLTENLFILSKAIS